MSDFWLVAFTFLATVPTGIALLIGYGVIK